MNFHMNKYVSFCGFVFVSSPILKGLGLIVNDFGLDFHSLMINSRGVKSLIAFSFFAYATIKA